jgi:hypothetical protein
MTLDEQVAQIRANLQKDEGWYHDREDWGDEGPNSKEGAVRILLQALDTMAGCAGGCSCEVWTSRHEAAMALYTHLDTCKRGKVSPAVTPGRYRV